MNERYAAFVVFGEKAERMWGDAVEALEQHNPDLQCWATSDAELGPGPGTPGRWAKVNLCDWSRGDQTLYLDVDTVVHEDVSAGFALLDDGWDMVITPSAGEWLGHLPVEERDVTESELGWRPLQLQAGVFWFKRNDTVHRFFEAWREEWQRFEGEDQGAFIRALYRCPIRLWLMGRPWNGGDAIEHSYGALR